MSATTNTARGYRRSVLYGLGLLVAAAMLFGLGRLQLYVSQLIYSSGMDQQDYSNPLVVARSVLGKVVNVFYLPTVFWLLVWIRRRYLLSEDEMASTTVIMAAVMLSVTVLPDSLIPEWSRTILEATYHAVYGMGLCLLLLAPLVASKIRTLLLGWRLGTIALMISLTWWALVLVDPGIAKDSFLWPVVYVVSITIVFLGLLTFQRVERILATTALVLLTVYLFSGKAFWMSVNLAFDRNFRTPLDLIGLLAWSAAAGWGLGIFRRIGHPFEKPSGNKVEHV